MRSNGGSGTAPPWERLAHHFADELVARWHDADPADDGLPESISDFMGLTDGQYAAWVEGRWEDVLPDA